LTTWTYWFPVSVENHDYRLGLMLNGSYNPFPPQVTPSAVTVSIKPHPVPLNVMTSVTVTVTDSSTGNHVTGDVFIDGILAGHANIAFNYLFKTRLRRVRVVDPVSRHVTNETVVQGPIGVLRIAGKPDIRLDWGI